MKIAICEDDKLCTDNIAKILTEYSLKNSSLEITCSYFTRGEMLLDAAEKNGGFDIYLLDVVMPGINGIDLGIKLRNEGYDGKIIYLTSSKEYALDSFKAKAFDYILKPVKAEQINPTLDEAVKSASLESGKNILIKSSQRNIKVAINSIMYARLEKRVVVYYLTNNKTIKGLYIRNTFPEAVSELLADSRFTLCGAGTAVNLHHITSIENDALVFADEQSVYIGKKLCREIRSKWCDYWFNKEDSKCLY